MAESNFSAGRSFEPLPGGKTRVKTYAQGGTLLSDETIVAENALKLVGQPIPAQTALTPIGDRSLTTDRDHQLRAFASQVMRVELTEDYDYSELAIDVHEPEPVEGRPGAYDLYVQGFGDDNGCVECVEWSIRLGFDASGKVVQLDFTE